MPMAIRLPALNPVDETCCTEIRQSEEMYQECIYHLYQQPSMRNSPCTLFYCSFVSLTRALMPFGTVRER